MREGLCASSLRVFRIANEKIGPCQPRFELLEVSTASPTGPVVTDVDVGNAQRRTVVDQLDALPVGEEVKHVVDRHHHSGSIR